MSTAPTNLPVLDLAPYMAGEAGAAERLAAELREINETIGFMTIIGHGVPAELTAATFEQAARFHALPPEDKLVEPHFSMLWRGDIPRITRQDADGRRAKDHGRVSAEGVRWTPKRRRFQSAASVTGSSPV